MQASIAFTIDEGTFHMHIMWMPDSPSLIEVDQEHKVISKHSNAVGGWHDNDEGKDIINECVEGLEKNIFSTSICRL